MNKKLLIILFRIFLVIIVLELGLRLSGFLHLQWQEHQNKIPADDGIIKVLALGDSMTYGGEDSWPRQLEEILNERSDLTFKVISRSEGGETSTEVAEKIGEYLDTYQPHIVITMIGTADEGEKEAFHTSLFSSFFRSLRIIKLAKHAISSLKNPVGVILVAAQEENMTAIDRVYLQAAKQYEDTRYDAAVRLLQEGLKEYPESAKLLTGLGRAYFARGEYREAIAVLQKAIDADPTYREAYTGLYITYNAINEKEKAIQVNEKLLQFSPTPEFFVIQGRALRDIGRNDEAKKMFFKAIEIDPGYSEAYVSLGILESKERNLNLSQQYFEKAVRLKPSDVQTWLRLGQTYYALGRLKEARGAYEKILEINPSEPRVYFELGSINLDEGRFDEAIYDFERHLTGNPDHLDTYLYLAQAYGYKIDLNAAIATYKRGMHLHHPLIESKLAHTYIELGRSQEAEDVLSSITDQKHLWIVYTEMGKIYDENNKTKQAEVWYAKADELIGSHVDSLTRKNYQLIYQALHERNIPLIAMQYPTIPLAQLQAMFDDGQEVIFVGNEEFNEALKTTPREDLFTDHQFGSFGHCTRKGYRMIAEKVAPVILSLVS
ncbi:TPA: tetratricopeptide repeat protein [Candidatus Woesearchaeota archaeon]|nr:tetratricopeptide repeat protein [Candidatus Woesearchaeota archaeon]HIJ03702.1 tetratricopeptide repeat protein [Candidatus Woesearchaeota archaeon]